MGLLTSVVSAIQKIFSLTRLVPSTSLDLCKLVCFDTQMTENTIGKKSHRSIHHTLLLQKIIPWGILHGPDVLSWGHWVWPNRFCLQLLSVELIAAAEHVHWAPHLSAWEYQELTGDWEEKKWHVLPRWLKISLPACTLNTFYKAFFPVQSKNDSCGWNTWKRPLPICRGLLMMSHLCLSRRKTNSYSSDVFTVSQNRSLFLKGVVSS